MSNGQGGPALDRVAERVVPVPLSSRTDRLMARIAIFIFCGGLVYGAYALGQPLYWRLYATVINPFVHDPAHVASSGAHDDRQLHPASTSQPTAAPALSPPPKPLNLDDYPLTRERVVPLLQDGLIMITWANHHYLDFARTWIYHVRTVGVTGYMVGAMDDDMLKDLVYDPRVGGRHTWRMNTGITKHDLGWGSPNFHKMGRAKISLIKSFLDLDVAVVISDIDTAWIQNPLPYFARYPEADILTSSDQLGPTVKDDSLELFPNAGSSFNIGIMLFRQKSKTFVEQWVKALEDPQMWDQNAFNNLARQGHAQSTPPKNLWKGYDGKLMVGVLPVTLFCSGHTFFVQRKYRELGLKPYVAHATFQYSGTPGKRHRFREALLWDDPPSYFNHRKGFIHIKMDIPAHILEPASKQVRGPMRAELVLDHFRMVHHQLLHLRAALAIATITGRAIILPPILCQLDKYWAPLYDGNIPGSEFIKPFICPADHVLDLEGGWHPRHDVNHRGPHIDYREYSFLQNPRLTKAVNSSWQDVVICAPGDAACGEGDKPAPLKDGKLMLAPNRTSDQLRTALEAVADVKILSIANTLAAFSRFTDQAAQDRWEARLKHYTSVACCLQDNPGWIWYDFFWDMPHRDRLGRDFTDKWMPYKGDTREAALPPGVARRALLEVDAGSARTAAATDSGALPQLQQQDTEVEMVDGASLRGQQLLWHHLPRRILAAHTLGSSHDATGEGVETSDLAAWQERMTSMGMNAMHSFP